MAVIVAVVVWAFIITASLALLRWWWVEVHSKSKEDQARAVLEAVAAGEEFRSEHRASLQGGAAPADGVGAPIAPSSDGGAGPF